MLLVRSFNVEDYAFTSARKLSWTSLRDDEHLTDLLHAAVSLISLSSADPEMEKASE